MWRFTVPLGRVGGTRLGAHWSALVIFGLLTSVLALSLLPITAPEVSSGLHWMVGAAVSGCFLVSLLTHELAHAVTAGRYGVPTRRITLWMLGGAAELDAEAPGPRSEFVIAAAGPATSLAVGGACWAVAVGTYPLLPPIALVALLWLGLANLVLAGFNLLPGAPLDGGRMLRAVVWKRTGDRFRAARVAGRCGQIVGVVLIAAGAGEVILYGQFAGIWLSIIGWFLIGGASIERHNAELGARLGDLPVRALMRSDRQVAPAWWTVETFLERNPAGRKAAFPVVSFDGSPVGVVHVADLSRLSVDERRATRVSDVSRRPPSVSIIAADTPVSAVLVRATAGPNGSPLLVAQDSTFVGVLSARDLGLAEPRARRP